MGSTRSGAAPAGTGRAAEADLLASAAALRWSRPDLTAALADHVLETAVAEDDLDGWLRAAGWAVHARSATGDGRVVAVEVLDALSRWGGEPLSGRAAHRLRVELAVLAAAAGEVQAARVLLEPVMVDEVPAGLRADAYCALARCAAEDSPTDVAAALRRAESAWSDVAAPRADIGIAAVALVAAATARRAGRSKRAVERAAEGLERLDRGRGAAQIGTASGHLSAALAAEWISALLDAGRLSEARTACEPWVERLRGNIRPSRQVARLRLTVAGARATGPEADATEALEKAAVDAVASDAPDLESVCHSALGALHETSGAIDAALESMRLGVAAQLRDSRRASGFLDALRSVLPSTAPGARNPDRVTAMERAPRDQSSPRSLSRSAHERVESLDRIDADLAAADPWSTGRWSTSSESDTGSGRAGRGGGSNGWGGTSDHSAALDLGLGSGRHGTEGHNGSRYDGYDTGSYADESHETDTVGGYSSGDGLEIDHYAAEPTRSGSSTSDHYSFSSEWEAGRAEAAAAERSAADRFARDWSNDWASSRADRDKGSNGNGNHGDDADREPSRRGGTETNGRSRNGKSRGETEAGGRRRRSPEPVEPVESVEPVADRRPLEMPEIDTDADGWLQSALAELDRVWGKPADPAPALAPAPDHEATGCTVVIDVAREGQRLAGRRARAVMRDLTERLSDRLPAGARLRQDDNDALSVVLPGWSQAEATQWMHRTLTGLLEGFTAAEDLVSAQLRAGVHDADGPVGAQLVQRLDATPSRRTDPVAREGRRSAPVSAPARSEDRWAELDAAYRDPDDGPDGDRDDDLALPPASSVSERERWSELGSSSRRHDRDAGASRDGDTGRHDARGRTPFRLEEHLGRGVERERVERARSEASRHRRPSDTGAVPAVQPSRNGATDTGSTRAVTAERSDAVDNASTEGLGLADLLAGALAAYRGI